MKADVQNVSGELIVSGLDSATSLIQAAKNLMNAVVLTVKASYVASTKYPRQAAASGLTGKPIVVWKMKVPVFIPCGQVCLQPMTNLYQIRSQVVSLRHLIFYWVLFR